MNSIRPNLYNTASPNRPVSPIHYVKPSSVYYANNLSPNKSVQNTSKKQTSRLTQDVSPIRNLPIAQQEEVDLWKSRCNELETSLCQVNTDLELADFKAKKAKNLESKVDDIIKQNAQLLGENDQLSKQFSQKRTESDIWKSKYDAQINTIISIKSNYETEVKRLQSELSQQRELNDLLQQERMKDVQESKSQILHDNHTHIESLKRSHCSNITLYEEQLRKMREAIEEREKEVNNLQNKLNESKNYADSESNRLNEDKERLRMKISQMELDQGKELENQKRRCDTQSLEQVRALKKLHESELDVLESELNKLKNLLEMKNSEIQSMIIQNKTQKRNFESELQAVREENAALKDKILENNFLKEQEIEDIQNKLTKLHTTDVQNMKNHHEGQVRVLSNENEDLKRIIALKSEEIDNQLREKMAQRDSYNGECDRLTSEIETNRLKYQVLLRDKQKDYEEFHESITRANTAHSEFSDQQRRQLAFLENEIEKLKQLLVHKNNEIDINISQHRTIKTNLEEDLRQLKLDNADIRQRYQNQEHQKNIQIDEQRNKIQNIEVCNMEKVKKYEAQIDYLENELKRNRENLQVKTEEANNNYIHRNLSETENKKLNQEIDSLNTHLIMLEKLKTQEISDLRQKLESSNIYTIDSIKNSHNNQIDSMQSEIEDLKAIIDIKDRQVSEKTIEYQRLEKSLNEIRENSDLSDYQQRISRLGAEVATTKNLYDVFARTRPPSSGNYIMPNNTGVSPVKRINQFN